MEKKQSYFLLQLKPKEADMDEEMLLPTEVAIRIPNHRFFIFEIYRLIQRELKKSVTFGDLLEFLGTNYREVAIFKSTRRPPKKWLIKLTQSKEGIKILDYFGVYYGNQMECFSHDWKRKERWESREIEKIFDVSGLKREEVTDTGTEKLLDLGILDSSDLSDSVKPPDDFEITDDVIAIVDDCLRKLKKISENKDGYDSIGDRDVPNIKGGTNMNAVIGNNNDTSKMEIISTEDRNSFLTRVKTLLKISDNSIFKEKFGEDEIKNFKETGVILEKWKVTLCEAGCGDFLGICDIISGDNNDSIGKVDEGLVSEESRREVVNKKECTEGKESGLIPKDMAKLILPKLFKESGFKSKKEFVVFLGLSQNSYSLLARGLMRLRIDDVEDIAEKKGCKRDEFFKKVGLGYLVEDMQAEKTETNFDPVKDASDNAALREKGGIGISKEAVPSGEFAKEEWMDINKIIQTALFEAGGISNDEIRREFFLGYLLVKLSGYCMEFFQDEKKICIKNGDSTLEFELGHIPF